MVFRPSGICLMAVRVRFMADINPSILMATVFPMNGSCANGLNPNDPSDAVAIADNGYAHIENYSFSITSAYPYIKNPSELKVAAQEKESIALSWVDNADNESGFVIEISTDNKTFTEAGRVAANVTTHTVSGLIPETVYYFRLKSL